MSLSVVQGIGKAAGAGNCAFTLGSAPTAGNGLLAFVKYNGGYAISPPSGSKWIWLANTNQNGQGLAVYWHIVISGDGTDWTFPVTGDYTSGELYEVTGANNQSPLAGVARASSGSGAASIVSPSAAPAVSNSLAFASETDDGGTSISSVTSGWTLLADTGSYHGGGTAYMNMLTTSAASCTYTMGGTSGSYDAVTILIAPAAETATLYVAQDGYSPAGAGNIVLAMSDAPSDGSIMLATAAWNGSETITPPDGWTQVYSINNEFNDAMGAWWRAVQSGDGSSYTFTLSGDYGSGQIFEIAGADTTSPVNGQSAVIDNSDASSRTTPALTPTVIGCLPFGAEDADGTADAISTVTAAWMLMEAHGNYHGSSAAWGPLTTDTSTPVDCTFTYTATAGAGGAATILIAPAGGAAHTATAALTVTPSFSAARTRGKYRTGALTVTPSFSAARVQVHVRTAALTVTPVFRAVPSGGAGRPAVTQVPDSDEAREFKRWLLWDL